MWAYEGRDVMGMEKLHNRELVHLTHYCSRDNIDKNEMGGECSRYGRERRGLYRVMLGKPEGKRPLGRPKRRWENNIKMDLLIVGCGDMNWIDLVQDMDRLAGSCECGNGPSVYIKFGAFLDWLKTG